MRRDHSFHQFLDVPLPPSLQQRSAMPPHDTQALFTHSESGPVQRLPLQHGWPAAPHVPLPHEPPTHRVTPHEVPLALQRPSTQQAPFAQAPPPQHGWSAPPHTTQVPTLG